MTCPLLLTSRLRPRGTIRVIDFSLITLLPTITHHDHRELSAHTRPPLQRHMGLPNLHIPNRITHLWPPTFISLALPPSLPLDLWVGGCAHDKFLH